MAHNDSIDTRYRSRSPADRSKRAMPSSHRRSQSPHAHPHHSHHKRKRSPSARSTVLPFSAPRLSKGDFPMYEPMFALYLDIQKKLLLEELPATEAKGRWKSFVGKWNRGELAEGWYDPVTLQKAIDSAAKFTSSIHITEPRRSSPVYGESSLVRTATGESSDDDAVGPALPNEGLQHKSRTGRLGPAIPGMQDLEMQRELAAEDSISAREALRYQRASERKQEKERLEELAPRAEAGSKERMLEKKREKAATNRAFASAKTDAGDVPEVPESDLLGDDDGGIEGFKKQKKEMERKKNEREIRREEVLRARAVERDERVQQYRRKEEATMKGLVELAKARYG